MGRLFARNTGNVDRIIRVIVGAVLVGNVFVFKWGDFRLDVEQD